MKWIGAMLMAAVLVFPAAGCSGSTNPPAGTTTQKSYTCSMCGGSYEAPGKCPKCGMALIRR